MERLLKSRAECADAEASAGCEAGKKWVAEHAEYDHLRAANRARLSEGFVAADVADAIGCDAAEVFGDDWESLSRWYCLGFFATLKVAYSEVEEAAAA